MGPQSPSGTAESIQRCRRRYSHRQIRHATHANAGSTIIARAAATAPCVAARLDLCPSRSDPRVAACLHLVDVS